MPLDGKGRFHLNTQRAMGADKFRAREGMPPKRQSGEGAAGVGDPMAKGANESDIGGDSTQTTITHNGDGTHSVQHADGDETGPHEHLHEAFAHISAKQHPDDAHSHVLHEADGTHTSHHAKDGEVSGPHSHPDMDALREHMDRFLAEEGREPEHGGKGGSMHEPAMMGM